MKKNTEVINERLSASAELLSRPPHRTSIDPSIIKAIGVRVTERILTEAYGKPVKIRESANWEITFNKAKRHVSAVYYIAEVNDVDM